RTRKAERDQPRPQHEPSAVRSGHDKGPGSEASQSNLHAKANAMPVPITPVINGPADEQKPGSDAHDAGIDDNAAPNKGGHRKGDRQGVAKRDGNRRQPDDPAIAAMEPQRNGKEPAHAGVEAMEGPNSGQGEPGQSINHFTAAYLGRHCHSRSDKIELQSRHG